MCSWKMHSASGEMVTGCLIILAGKISLEKFGED
jgi:hypothetical protein